VLRVNARHLKQVPGRKSEVRDGHGIAQLLQPGLLKGRLIPPRPPREWRDLTRLSGAAGGRENTHRQPPS
jgi:hypothetical protein